MILEKILESYPTQAKKERDFKIQLDSKTLIYGGFSIGKTSIVLNYFEKEEFKNYKKLYIDLEDIRLNPKKDLENLQEFLEKEKIQVLILDNFSQEFLKTLPKNKLRFLALISNYPLDVSDFTLLEIPPLSFSEFYKLQKTPIDLSFNSYLRFGNILEQNKGYFLKGKLKDSSDFWILRSLILHLGQKVSIYQIFTKLKKEGRISKDRFYEFCKMLESSKMLFWVNKFEHKLAPKKLYFWDFTLKNAISYEKNFTLLFENMVFLELIFNFKLEVFYSDKLDFYIPKLNLGILCCPFVQNLQIRLSKIGKEREFCDSLLIITLNDKKSGEFQGMPYIITSFSAFALKGASILSHNI
ncbi:MAG: ATP-binding protein [Helicobacteraceae bacterium]|nr:ATP-binding protein [Helicobacteraceae bacterium]